MKEWRRSAREIVKDGVLQGYFLGSYSARKLGLRSTGNAGGNHNLSLDSTVKISSDCCARWDADCW